MRDFILALFILSACTSTPPLKDKPAGPPKVHGHRGSRGTHPENTIPAFQEAIEAGADVLELDLHMSKDGIPVVSHDSALDPAICKLPKRKKRSKILRIHSMTVAEIQNFDCGSLVNPRFPEQKPIPGTKIPTFSEVLELVAAKAPNIELNIETKMDEPRSEENPDPKVFAETVITLLKKHDLLKRSILQSFDFRTIVEAKKLESSLRTSALVEKDKGFCELAASVKADIASPEASLVNLDRVKACHVKGIQVAPWTVNSEAEWKKLIGFGVDAIITDYPRKLLTFLRVSH